MIVLIPDHCLSIYFDTVILSVKICVQSSFICTCMLFYTFIGGGRVEQRCWVNFQCRGVLLVWIIVGQGPIALAKGAGGGCLDFFCLNYLFSSLSLSLGDGPI